ncbi:unnamed protein product [Trichobilharzia regenti]|nr:unnamed protein product [Trichobilharzia regenti]
MDYFIKQGFIPQPLNPFLVETANKFNENADTDMTYCSQEYSSHGNALSPSHQVNSINCSTNNSEWLNMLNKRIESIRQKIIHAKCDLSYAKDSRVKQFRVTEVGKQARKEGWKKVLFSFSVMLLSCVFLFLDLIYQFM